MARRAPLFSRRTFAMCTFAGAGAAASTAAIGRGHVGPAVDARHAATQVACGDGMPMSAIEPPTTTFANARLIDVGDGELWHWDTGGHGEPVIFLHSFTGSGRNWGYQQTAFASAGFRTIGYSRRGHWGSSEVNENSGATSVDDLIALADSLGLEKFHLVGTAAGGFPACVAAIERPQRLLSLTLACTMLGIPETEFEPLVFVMGDESLAKTTATFRELSPSYRTINPAGVAAWEHLHNEAYSQTQRPNQPVGVPNSLARLRRIQTPTLLIAGGADLISPPPVLHLYSRNIHNSKTLTITEAGHSAYWERPLEFNKAVIDFIRSFPVSFRH